MHACMHAFSAWAALEHWRGSGGLVLWLVLGLVLELVLGHWRIRRGTAMTSENVHSKLGRGMT